MVSRTFSAGVESINGFLVTIEVDYCTGLPSFDIVGLPDASVKEAKERVRAALKNSGFSLRPGKITVNMAPAEKKKEGSSFDFPILIGLLISTGQLSADVTKSAFIGELSLTGEVRPVNGILPMVMELKKCGIEQVFLSRENASEASIVDGIDILPVEYVNQAVGHLLGATPITKHPVSIYNPENYYDTMLDFADVAGQQLPKKAIETAASGGHNILLIGPPGTGKSMLAKRIPSILPDMSFDEALETTKIHSILGLLSEHNSFISSRPFRAPHHTISYAGMTGGGTIPKPGELSLAHNGILFLDELPEYNKMVLEVLRQPLEDGSVRIARASGSAEYPCSIMLVCAMNPCKCGFFGHPSKKCKCSFNDINKYISKISGPLLDRIDIQVEVPAVSFGDLTQRKKGEHSYEIRKRVNIARGIQLKRFAGTKVRCNAQMTGDMVAEYCILDDEAKNLLKMIFNNLSLSARGYDRILKVARTIADIKGHSIINADDIAEAAQYRALDKKYFNSRV